MLNYIFGMLSKITRVYHLLPKMYVHVFVCVCGERVEAGEGKRRDNDSRVETKARSITLDWREKRWTFSAAELRCR